MVEIECFRHLNTSATVAIAGMTGDAARCPLFRSA